MPARLPINPHVIEMEYAVRGPIPQRAEVLKGEGRRTIPCNIGNPQALGQPVISFFRQVVALLEEPARLDREKKLNRILTHTPGIADELREEDLVSDYVLDYVQNMLDQWPSHERHQCLIAGQARGLSSGLNRNCQHEHIVTPPAVYETRLL